MKKEQKMYKNIYAVVKISSIICSMALKNIIIIIITKKLKYFLQYILRENHVREAEINSNAIPIPPKATETTQYLATDTTEYHPNHHIISPIHETYTKNTVLFSFYMYEMLTKGYKKYSYIIKSLLKLPLIDSREKKKVLTKLDK